MEAIEQWFNGESEYYQGVAIYASLPIKKLRTLKTLNKGKSRRNMSVLVSELRKYKNTYKPAISKPIVIAKPKAPTQTIINLEAERQQQTTKMVEREFKSIMLGDLPAKLRPRYSKARNIFTEMIELKFVLNDLPAKSEASALKIQLRIDELDQERDLIWKELRHWEQFKTLLPTETNDYSGLDRYELDKKKRNIASNITKMQKRVDAWYNDLDKETNKHQQHLIENKINKAERTLHQHKINVKKIESLL